MLSETANAWVQANCPNPKLRQDVAAAIATAQAERSDCWFIFGSKLTRRLVPYLLHCFGDEMFVFQLTEAQAAARGVKPGVLCSARHRHPLDDAPPKPIVSVERFELKDAVLSQSQPIIGRVHYEVRANFTGRVGVRLDYALGESSRTAWDYTERPLWGKGMLDVAFMPIAPEAAAATDFRGPLAMFVHLVDAGGPPGSRPRRPISNIGAALVEIT